MPAEKDMALSQEQIFRVQKAPRKETKDLPVAPIMLRKHRKVIQKKTRPDLADADPTDAAEDPESEYTY